MNHLKVGIDTLAFYVPPFVMDLADLAAARQIDPNKYAVGLGQNRMAVASPDEDIVTMGANAAKRALKDIDLNAVDMLLFATESSLDQSKAAGIYLHDMLGLSNRCRVVELKQACYAGTLGLQLTLPYLRENPGKKVLLVASDIARYGLDTPGEPSQGCGAVAMVLSANPRILAIDREYGVITENIMDFWRPTYRDSALVDGKYSSRMYLQILEKTWKQYAQSSGRNFADLAYVCYHTPVSRLAEKAHCYLNKVAGGQVESEATLLAQVGFALKYSREIGNCYTASLYLGLASLLDHAESMAGQRIGFYSYGSGCVAEFFSGVVQSGYEAVLDTAYHQAMLAARTKLSYSEYETFYNFSYPTAGELLEIPQRQSAPFRLARITEHKRIYENSSAG